MNTGRYLHYSLKLLNNEKVNPLETNKHHTSITNGILNRPIRGQNAKANHGSCFVTYRIITYMLSPMMLLFQRLLLVSLNIATKVSNQIKNNTHISSIGIDQY